MANPIIAILFIVQPSRLGAIKQWGQVATNTDGIAISRNIGYALGMDTVLVSDFQIRRGANGPILWLNSKRSVELTQSELKSLSAELDKQQTQSLGQKTFPAEIYVPCQHRNGLVMLKMRRQVALALSNQLAVRVRE